MLSLGLSTALLSFLAGYEFPLQELARLPLWMTKGCQGKTLETSKRGKFSVDLSSNACLFVQIKQIYVSLLFVAVSLWTKTAWERFVALRTFLTFRPQEEMGIMAEVITCLQKKVSFFQQSRAQTATELLLELNEDVSGDFVDEVLLTDVHNRTDCVQRFLQPKPGKLKVPRFNSSEFSGGLQDAIFQH